MSHVITTIQFPDKSHGFTVEEAEALTQAEFDALPLCELVNLYNNHRHVYDRLTGHSTDIATSSTTPQDTTPEKAFAEEFEKIVDDAIRRAFHLNEG